ncbi:3600_t:CDS:2, partial [Gigaspora margarita]
MSKDVICNDVLETSLNIRGNLLKSEKKNQASKEVRNKQVQDKEETSAVLEPEGLVLETLVEVGLSNNKNLSASIGRHNGIYSDCYYNKVENGKDKSEAFGYYQAISYINEFQKVVSCNKESKERNKENYLEKPVFIVIQAVIVKKSTG